MNKQLTALFALASGCAAALCAQTPASPAATPTTEETIRSSTREVVVDVVVRDKHGKPVATVTPDKLAVFEDGVRQKIASFRLVKGNEVRAEDEKEAAEALGKPVQNPVTFNPLRIVNVVCLVFNDLSPETRATAFHAAEKFVDNEVRPNTFIGVFTLDRTGIHQLISFNNRRDDLLHAIKLAAVNQWPYAAAPAQALLNGLSVFNTPGTAVFGSVPNFQPPLGYRGEVAFAEVSDLWTIDHLHGLVNELSPLPFQKTVLLISNGLSHPADRMDNWNSLIRDAREGGVTFFGFDPWGLGACQDDPNPDCLEQGAHSAIQPSVQALKYAASLSGQQANLDSNAPTELSGPPASAAAAQALGTPTGAPVSEKMSEFDYVRFAVKSGNRQDTLRELAEDTGGFDIANTDNIALLNKVMEDVDTHYEITYRPGSEKDDGHFRKIEVKLDRADLRIETRPGYFAVPDTGAGPLTATEIAGFQALDEKTQPHAFLFGVQAYRYPVANGDSQIEIAFDIPIAGLTATPQPSDHTQAIHGSLLAVVKDAQGQIVQRLSKDVSSVVSDVEFAKLRSQSMTYAKPVTLRPGHYTIETAVVDWEGRRQSTSVTNLDTTAQTGPGISDMALVRSLEDLRREPNANDPMEFDGKLILPAASNQLASGIEGSVYFIVYPGDTNAAKLAMHIEVFRNGQLVAKRDSPLEAADSSGRVRVLIGAVPEPGTYEVKVSAPLDGRVVERSLKYTVAGPSAS